MAAWAVDPGGPAGAAPILFSFNSPAIANAELLKKQAQMMSAVPGYEQLNKDSKCIQYTGARSRTARNELRCQCAWLCTRVGAWGSDFRTDPEKYPDPIARSSPRMDVKACLS
jgi:hypothetical protein